MDSHSRLYGNQWANIKGEEELPDACFFYDLANGLGSSANSDLLTNLEDVLNAMMARV